MDDTTTAPIVWRPTAEAIEQANVTRLMRKAGVDSTEALHAWSVEDIGRFWDVALEDLGLSWYEPYTRTVDQSAGFPWAKWFIGGKTNIILNCLDRHVDGDLADAVALVGEGDDGEVRQWTYAALKEEVNRAAGLLRDLDVKPGDRIGIYMPMVPEVVIALFACFQVGAVAIPVFSAYGSEALAVRLEDAKAVVLFTADGGYRRGKVAPVKPSADLAVADVASLRHQIVLKRTGQDVDFKPGRDLWWHEHITPHAPDPKTEVLDAEAPRLRREAGGPLLLADRHRLDDGPVGDDRRHLPRRLLPRLRRCAQLAESGPPL